MIDILCLIVKSGSVVNVNGCFRSLRMIRVVSMWIVGIICRAIPLNVMYRFNFNMIGMFIMT